MSKFDQSQLQNLDVDVPVPGGAERVKIDLWDELFVKNIANPAEVVSKMNSIPRLIWWVGSAQVDINTRLSELEDDFKMWLEVRKNEYDGEKSEAGRERQVMVKYEAEYTKKKAEIRAASFIVSKLNMAFKAMDKQTMLIQSMGAMIRKEAEKSDQQDLPVDSTKQTGQSPWGDQ